MSIPASQLRTWSQRPDPARSAKTYESAQTALDRSRLSTTYNYDRYLQGSYANATNIRSDSDVDVVVEMESTFRRDINRLSHEQQSRYLAQAVPGTHELSDFKRDVKQALIDYYGSARVSEGNKCLKVTAFNDRLPIDVLPCQEYRLYTSYPPGGNATYYEGVYFVTRDGRGVVNYPKLHRKNGETKQSRTGDNYKSLVRTVKNARRKLYEDGVISKDLSPSYFVECLLYNIPNSEYGSDLAQTYLNVLNWLNDNRSTFASMKCQNGVTDLFGSTPEQWKVDKAEQLVNVLIRQWNNWPN